MKKLTKNMMIAAAALMVLAGVAQAQMLKVEIPFSFRAAGTVMPAGQYRISALSRTGSPVFLLVNAAADHSKLAMSHIGDFGKPDGDAKLTFECGDAHCALIQLSSGDGATYGFSSPGIGRTESTRVAVIRAVLVK